MQDITKFDKSCRASNKIRSVDLHNTINTKDNFEQGRETLVIMMGLLCNS